MQGCLGEHAAVLARAVVAVRRWLFAPLLHGKSGRLIRRHMHAALKVCLFQSNLGVNRAQHADMFISPMVRGAKDRELFVGHAKMFRTTILNKRKHLQRFHRAAWKSEQVRISERSQQAPGRIDHRQRPKMDTFHDPAPRQRNYRFITCLIFCHVSACLFLSLCLIQFEISCQPPAQAIEKQFALSRRILNAF